MNSLDPSRSWPLFDTSSQSWLERSADPAVRRWLASYLGQYVMHVSAITVVERVRGYTLLLTRAAREQLGEIETAPQTYLDSLGKILPVDSVVALLAGGQPRCCLNRPLL